MKRDGRHRCSDGTYIAGTRDRDIEREREQKKQSRQRAKVGVVGQIVKDSERQRSG